MAVAGLPIAEALPQDALASSREIERQLLGALLRDASILPRIRAVLSAEHFSTALGERLYMAMERSADSGRTIRPDEIVEEAGHYEWDEPGGVDRFVQSLLLAASPDPTPEEAAQRIKAAFMQRDLSSRTYDADIVAWAHDQASVLRQLSERSELRDALDWPSIVEEILSVGRSEISAVARRIELVFVHIIKALSSPDAWSAPGWRSEIDLHLGGLRSGFAPSMRRLLNLNRLWSRAREEAATALDRYGERLSRSVPAHCPVSLDDLLEAKAADDLVRLLQPPPA